MKHGRRGRLALGAEAVIFSDGFNYENSRSDCLWRRDFCVALNSFRYWRDKLFLLGCSLYTLNRWGIKPHVHNSFLHGYFNDVLLIPCALPLLLWFQRRLGLRSHDQAPTAGEIALYLGVWSILFEVIGPHLMRRATGDPYNVVAYVVGGVPAGIWWHRGTSARRRLKHEL